MDKDMWQTYAYVVGIWEVNELVSKRVVVGVEVVGVGVEVCGEVVGTVVPPPFVDDGVVVGVVVVGVAEETGVLVEVGAATEDSAGEDWDD
jgi:hypothetical protein